MSAQFTPGPWEWDGEPWNESKEYRDQNAPWLLDANRDAVLRGDIVCDSPESARLIEATPDLLAFLRSALITIERCGNYVSSNPESERPSFRTVMGCAGEEWLENAKAAIDKALSRAPSTCQSSSSLKPAVPEAAGSSLERA